LEILLKEGKIKKLSNINEEDLEMSEKRSFSEHTPKSKISDDSENFQKEEDTYQLV